MTIVFGGYLPLLLGCVFLLYCILVRTYRAWRIRVQVPVVGGRGVLGSWIAAFRYYFNARKLIQEGYDNHKDFAFQVAALPRWEIFICDKAMIREYKNLADSVMSSNMITADLFEVKYTLPGVVEGIHKLPTPTLVKALAWLRNRAANKNDAFYSEFYTEFLYALQEEMPVADAGWSSFPAFPKSSKIVARLTAKILVGLPFCRDPELVKLFCEYGSVIPPDAWFIKVFPNLLKPLAASMCSAPKLARTFEVRALEIMRYKRLHRSKVPNVSLLSILIM